MNEKKYLSNLKQYHQWFVAHQEKATEELAERKADAKEIHITINRLCVDNKA